MEAFLADHAEASEVGRAFVGGGALECEGGELAALVRVSMPRTRFDDLVIYDTHRDSLELLRSEQRERKRLAIHGLRPTRRLLLSGPSGTGRALTAGALAAELNLPLFEVQAERLASVNEAQRDRRLRLLAESMERSRGVYLLDGSGLASGVLSACLARLFLDLEHGESDSPFVLVLDREDRLAEGAVESFELSIHYFRPTRPVIEQLIRKRFQRFDLRGVSLAQIVARCGELNHAQITSACARAAKSAILRNSPYVEQADLLRALDDERRRVRR
ncbi:MAG: AAA family ATPase [Planctomycetes bacterium]|nr:AAA family ATPase [Planctomycetota bacterium]